jgi:hypothetical protein
VPKPPAGRRIRDVSQPKTDTCVTFTRHPCIVSHDGITSASELLNEKRGKENSRQKRHIVS